MGINPYDIVSTLQYLGMIKYWKGQHIILKKEDIIKTYHEKTRNRPRGRQIYPNALKWKPYEPTARERKQAEQIKKNQEERQKKRWNVDCCYYCSKADFTKISQESFKFNLKDAAYQAR